ncbi:MAG: tyrosine-type recombinase/integrase [Flavobacteriales bacterium]
MFEPFLEYLRFEKRFSNHTLIAYEHDLNQFVAFSEGKSISELATFKAVFIRGWIVSLMEAGNCPKTINRKLVALRTLYKWMRKEGYTQENPMARVNGPKTEKRLPVFAREKELATERIAALYGSGFNGMRDKLMLEVFYQTGIRLSELISLTIRDVQAHQIKVLGKRNKERIIPISHSLYRDIQDYLTIRLPMAKGNTLFILSNGKPLYPVFVYRRINELLGTLTTLDKKSPHVLRHTFATHMLNNGAGLETLKALLGHASLAATQVYTHNSFAQLAQIYTKAHPRMIRK